MNWIEETLVSVWGGGVDASALQAANSGAFEASQAAAPPASLDLPLERVGARCLAALRCGASALDDELAAFPRGWAAAAPLKCGRSLLHEVARSDDGDAVAVALAHGADLDARAPDGGTALHHACWRGAWRAAATLLGRGADARAENARGETAAAAARGGGHEGLARAVDAGLGADVSPGVPFAAYASRWYDGYGGRADVAARNAAFLARRRGPGPPPPRAAPAPAAGADLPPATYALVVARTTPTTGAGRGRTVAVPCAVGDRAGQESEIPNFKGSYLGRFPLVLADFWTSDHLSERSRSVNAFPGTRARGTLTLKRR